MTYPVDKPPEIASSKFNSKNSLAVAWLSGFNMVRNYNCHFYHFASVSANGEKRKQAELNGHNYAKYKWSAHIKHNNQNNLKFL